MISGKNSQKAESCGKCLSTQIHIRRKQEPNLKTKVTSARKDIAAKTLLAVTVDDNANPNPNPTLVLAESTMRKAV